MVYKLCSSFSSEIEETLQRIKDFVLYPTFDVFYVCFFGNMEQKFEYKEND